MAACGWQAYIPKNLSEFDAQRIERDVKLNEEGGQVLNDALHLKTGFSFG
jgi:hypothetical protein